METDDFPNLGVQDLLDTIDHLYGLTETDPEKQEPSDNRMFDRETLEQQGYAELQIDEIMRGISKNLPVAYYAKPCYNWKQMREIRLGLWEGLDISRYDNALFSAGQMREIRLGLLGGLDVSSYARLILSTRDMEAARRELMSDAYQKNPDGFAKQIHDEESGADIRISADCMEAYVKIPPEHACTEETLRRILKEHQITCGILEHALKQAVKGSAEEIRVAVGKPARKGENGRYEYFFNALLPGEPRVCADGSVDYATVVVADRRCAGDILAKYYPAKKGTDGETVTGIVVRGGYGVQKPQLKGQGIVYEEATHTYRAAEEGYVMLNEEEYTLNVRNVYIVDGDLNRYNGHITYDGMVYVHGSVGDNTEITASGNVVVDGYVEASHIRSGENIILRGGMNGGGSGFLEAGGKVIGKFFESATICAKGNIEGNYFMNCCMVTDRSVTAKGSKSKIMGGSIRAGYSVESYSVMAYGQAATTIDIGDPAWIGGRLKQAQEQLSKTREELVQLRRGKEKITEMLGDGASRQNALFHKTCVAIRMKEEEEEREALEEQYCASMLRRAVKAYIKVYGRLQAGVTLSVNGRTKKTDTDVKGAVLIERENIGE